MNKRYTPAALLLAAFSMLSACASGAPGELQPVTPTEGTTTEQPDTVSADDLHLVMTIGEVKASVVLDDHAAARELVARLPLTVELTDFNRTEKIFYPQPSLDLGDTPRGCAPAAGNITIYVPWGNVAIFYKKWSYSDDLVKLGHLDAAGLAALSATPGSVTVTIQRASK